MKKKITLHKHVSNLGLRFDVPMKSLSVRDLKSINELEKLWYEKRDISEKMTDENIVDVYCKIRTERDFIGTSNLRPRFETCLCKVIFFFNFSN